MEPNTADDDASDVAVAAGVGARRGRENDTLYRRPPAHPPVESASGGSWFASGGIEMSGAQPGEDGQEAGDDFGAATSSGSSRASFGFTDGPISPVRAPSGELPIQRKAASQAARKRAPQGPPAPAPRQVAPSQSWPHAARASQAESIPDPAPAAAWPAETDGWTAPPEPDFTWPAEEGPGAREIRHHEQMPDPARGPRQSRLVTAGLVLLSTVVLAGGAVAGVVYFSSSDTGVDSVLQLGAGKGGKRTVTAPLDNRTTASFELLAGTGAVHMTIGELGDDLYRISTPDDAGIKPDPVIRNDDVKLQVSPDGNGDGNGGEVDVVLSAKVRWALRFSGYAETQLIDVSGGQVSQIEMVAAMKRAELTLARADGTVPLKINGAVDQLTVKSPSSSPVRIKVGGGVQSVVAGDRTLKDVAAGSTLTPKGWDTADRYDVTAGARINALTIESA